MFSWIDVKCHPEILSGFGISEVFVPTLLAYSPVKKKFSFMQQEFKEAHIQEFLNNIRRVKQSKAKDML